MGAMKRLRITLAVLATLGLALPLAACGDELSAASGPETAPLDHTDRDIADLRVPGVAYDDHGNPEGLHAYIRWSDKIGQGAQPFGEVAFENLAKLGYKHVLSVDGAMPEVELAAKHGLRYIHVPIGYDGIPPAAMKQIVKAAEVDGPIYVHCHHGKHRGPCAAQILRMTVDGVSPGVGILGLERSGTNRDYRGLWKTVLEFRGVDAKELAKVGELPSSVTPKGVRAGMVDVNLRYEHLKLAEKAGWKTPKDHPDLAPAHEAKMLWELLREMHRSDTESKEKGDVFLAYLKDSETATIELEKAIRAGDGAAAKKHLLTVKGLCKDCHRDYRN